MNKTLRTSIRVPINSCTNYSQKRDDLFQIPEDIPSLRDAFSTVSPWICPQENEKGVVTYLAQKLLPLINRPHSKTCKQKKAWQKAWYYRNKNKRHDITETEMKPKFDIAYVLAKEGMAHTKMAPLCELQERHKVQIGENYRNNQACATFISFISEDLHVRLHEYSTAP